MNILFPIETLSREFDYKLAIAHKICSNNRKCRVYIGSVVGVHNLISDFKNGLYVSKTIFTSTNPKINKQRHKTFKEAGFDIIHLHEEGGVFLGEYDDWAESLRKLYDIEIFDEGDVVCVWGEAQKEIEEKRNPKNISIEVTGNPRFELNKAFSHLYEKNVQSLKRQYGNFILVNGNFAMANFGGSFKSLIDYCYDPLKEYNENLSWIMRWFLIETGRMYGMVELVLRAARELPDINFIYRPHPSELLTKYDDIFHDIPNVFVVREGPVNQFIIASIGIVHDGCTTALEAYKSGKPILNYKPKSGSSEIDLYLPNQVGYSTRQIEEALDYMRLMAKGSILKEDEDFESKALSLLYNLGAEDSFQKYFNVIQRKIDKADDMKSKAPSVFLIQKKYLKRYLRLHLSALKNKLTNNQIKQKRDNYLLNKYPGIGKKELKYKLGQLNESDNVNVITKFYNPDLIELRLGR